MFSFINKTGLSPSKTASICFNERPAKVIETGFYFMLKAFLFLKYLHFCPESLIL